MPKKQIITEIDMTEKIWSDDEHIFVSDSENSKTVYTLDEARQHIEVIAELLGCEVHDA